MQNSAMLWDVFAAIIMLLSVLDGFKKGLVKMISKVISFVLALITTFNVRTGVVEWLQHNGTYAWLQNVVGGWFNNVLPMVTQKQGTSTVSQSNLPDAVGNFVQAQTNAVMSGTDAFIKQMFGQMTTFMIDMLLLIAIFIVISIFLSFLTALLDKIASLPFIGSINRLAGGGVGFLKGMLLLYIFCAIAMFLSGTPPFKEWVGTLTQSTWMSQIYHHNLLFQIFAWKKG